VAVQLPEKLVRFGTGRSAFLDGVHGRLVVDIESDDGLLACVSPKGAAGCPELGEENVRAVGGRDR